MNIVQLVEQRIVAPKVAGSNPSIYPILHIYVLYNNFWYKNKIYKVTFFYSFLLAFSFLNRYYKVNDLLWQEGLLIDFLQKKIINNWLLKFLVNASYLFNERLIFDKIIKFYLDLIIFTAHLYNIFEANNVSNLFLFLFFLFLFLFFILIFFLFFALMF